MTKTAHTPGPWSISYKYGTRQILTADSQSIMGDETYYPWVPENDADWNLIAAAPDLLEMLELALESTQPDYDLVDWREDARAAIAKAKGGAA